MTSNLPVNLCEALLGRPEAPFDAAPAADLIRGKRVLVTGAGGSIGAELVRHIAGFAPEHLSLLDNSEAHLFAIDQEAGRCWPGLSRQDILCDIRDREHLQKWFADERPQLVFHAAALKHVSLAERHAIEYVQTNIIGTQNVADMCRQFRVQAMMLVSSDKAANPCNVMGATKRMAEAYCQALDAAAGFTHFLAVRFGNVLGAAGSVVPLFAQRLELGLPLSLTHPGIARYFMTPGEAASLILRAMALGVQGTARRGGVYVCDMGEPVAIADIAQRMIARSARPGTQIEFIGLRPGEKMQEDLTHPLEEKMATPEKNIFLVSARTSDVPILCHQITEMEKAAHSFDADRMVHLLKVSVPEFHRTA